MTARDGLFVVGAAGAGQTTPTEARLAMAGLFPALTGAIDARNGVFYGAGAPLAVSGTSGMNYSIAAGTAVINRSTSLGPYLLTNDAATQVTTTAAPGSNSRIDVIWIRQQDAEQGDASSAAEIGVTQGTAAASPTIPTLPVGAFALATAVVPAGTTRTDTGVTFNQVAPWTVARGARIPVRNQTERDAITPYEGLEVWRLDTHAVEIRGASGWLTYDTVPQSYTPTITGSTTGGALGSATVAAWYMRAGALVTAEFDITFGAGTSFGTGNLQIALPVTALAATPAHVGEGFIADVSVAGMRRGVMWELTSTSNLIGVKTDDGAIITAAAPWTWATGDILRGKIKYRIA